MVEFQTVKGIILILILHACSRSDDGLGGTDMCAGPHMHAYQLAHMDSQISAMGVMGPWSACVCVFMAPPTRPTWYVVRVSYMCECSWTWCRSSSTNA